MKIKRSGYRARSKAGRGILFSSTFVTSKDFWRSMGNSFYRAISGRTRYDILKPLKSLCERVQNSIKELDKQDDSEIVARYKLATLISPAITSLSSLVDIYQHHPKTSFFNRKKTRRSIRLLFRS